MKKFKRVLALMLAVMLIGFSFVACSSSDSDADKGLTIAVEKGSAGETEAKKLTNNVVSLSAQSDALKEVKAGTADACIIDSTMANSMTADGKDFSDLGYTVKLTTEEYGIGFRKGSDVTAKVNAIIDELVADGTLDALSEKYGVDLADTSADATTDEVTLNEYDDIIAKGKLVVGVTEYEPIDYQDSNGEWTGFDADFARAVAQKMGIEVEFVAINWDNRFTELKSGTIDCIWNGMTISDSVMTNCSVSKAYAGNSQVVVMKKDKLASYPDADSLNSLD
jgi:polar amino acid transport system substrate-binding protein